MTDLPEKTDKKPSLLDKSQKLLSDTLATLKGRDLHQLVEEFTEEATTVIEGLSEDQLRLRRENANLQTQQTLLEEEGLRRCQDITDRVDELERRLQALEKQVREKRARNVAGLTGVLRQATWLAGILAGAWIITTVLQLFRG